MNRRLRVEALRLLERLRRDADARLVADDEGGYRLAEAGNLRGRAVPAELVRLLLASGLLQPAETGRLAAAPAAEAWAKRQAEGEMPFRAQHQPIGTARIDGKADPAVPMNLAESPVAALARRSGPNGEAWLQPHAIAAAERLRRDFEIGGLQPRITANWSASINTGRRSGDGAGLTEITDMALAARRRFNKAIEAIGTELAGIAIDSCCFLKGLETVERERQWPARSAKLVLRLALESLARHYGLSAEAHGKPASRSIRHWGAEGYRPEIS